MFDLQLYEVMIMNVLNILRCMTIAGKYGFYTLAELSEVRSQA